jgi:hypothetical protein
MLWGPPSLLFSGYWVSFLEVKHDVDLSPPTGTEVENEWSCTFRPPVCIHGVDRDSFKFSIFFVNMLEEAM